MSVAAEVLMPVWVVPYPSRITFDQIRRAIPMNVLDTGRVRIEPQAYQHLLVTVYSEGEISVSDACLVREYFSRFRSKVPVMVVRDCRYSFSPEVFIMLMKEAASFTSAAAYVDRSSTDNVMTNYAKSTYLRDVVVRSFATQEEAASWVSQFGPLPDRKQT